jgi:hypothetical protein
MSAAAPPFLFTDDRFDLLMNMRCSVWKKSTTGVTGYGQPIEEFVQLGGVLHFRDGDQVVTDDIPCYVEQTSGKELNVPPAPTSETSTGIKTYTIFMRPLSVDEPPVPLSKNHYLQVKKPGNVTLDPNDKNSGAVMFDVTDVDDPGMIGHHYEVAATVLVP